METRKDREKRWGDTSPESWPRLVGRVSKLGDELFEFELSAPPIAMGHESEGSGGGKDRRLWKRNAIDPMVFASQPPCQ